MGVFGGQRVFRGPGAGPWLVLQDETDLRTKRTALRKDAFLPSPADARTGRHFWTTASGVFEARQQGDEDDTVQETVVVVGRRPTRGGGGGPPPESPFEAEEHDNPTDEDDPFDLFDPGVLPSPGFCHDEVTEVISYGGCTAEVQSPDGTHSLFVPGFRVCRTKHLTKKIPKYSQELGQWTCEPQATEVLSTECDDACFPDEAEVDV